MGSVRSESAKYRAAEGWVNAVKLTDEQLMAAVAQGGQDGLESLMGRYQNDIFRFCVHYLKDVERAKELTQETFIRVYTASSRFDPARKFKPWVLCIARNLCLNEIKRKRTVPMESLEAYAETRQRDSKEVLRTAGESPDEAAMSEERRQLLEKALETLKDEAREIVLLRFFQRKSAREIAEIVGSTEGAVRTKLHRILMSLRTEFMEFKKDL